MENTIWQPRLEGAGGATLLEKTLSSRGIRKDDESFLDPKIEDLHDPMLIPDMGKAVARLLSARERGERVTVYADYDVDGTTACAILLRYFACAGIKADFYIPNRLTEGYGMQAAPLDGIRERGTDLIVTVDNGISASAAVKRANELGMDVIVTDHHEPPEELPEALAVLDCKRADSRYPFKELCGASVAFKLVCALDEALGLETKKTPFLQLAAIATIADIVPLEDENRVIARIGIDTVNTCGARNNGIRALMQAEGIEKVSSGNIAYRLAPAINAAGRLGEAGRVMDLLLGDDRDSIVEAARHLKRLNDRRKRIEEKTLEAAVEQVNAHRLFEDDVIVVSGEGWHPGVIGIVASRLQEIWPHPVLIAGTDGEEPAKGSGRSIPGFNLFAAMQAVGDVFESYGGHEQAAGFSIRPERISELRERINAHAARLGIKDLLVRRYRYDGEATEKNFTVREIEELSALEPYGQGNPRPLFLYVPEDVTSARAVGEGGEHLSLVCDGVRGIFFGAGELAGRRLANHTRLLVSPSVDRHFPDDPRPEIRIEDLAFKRREFAEKFEEK